MTTLKEGFTVLHVDDSKTIRKMVLKILVEIGIKEENIDNASNGKSGLQKLEEGKSYDVVLLDWSMPGMTGIEMLGEVRKHENSKISTTPVIMVTAEALKENIIKAARVGANGYITKPFTGQRLLEVLNKAL